MKYLNNAPFSSQPATENYRNNYPFRDKFAEALAAEMAAEQAIFCFVCNCTHSAGTLCLKTPKNA
jgi:hypothetical protein